MAECAELFGSVARERAKSLGKNLPVWISRPYEVAFSSLRNRNSPSIIGAHHNPPAGREISLAAEPLSTILRDETVGERFRRGIETHELAF